MLSLVEFFEFHYYPKRLANRSPETTRLYRCTMRAFSRTLGRQATLADLNNEAVILHMRRLVADGRSRATANKDRSQLLALWRYAVTLGMVTTWPDVPPEIEPQRVPQAWTADDVRSLMRAIDYLPGKIDRIDNSLWWRTLIMVCLDSGERVGALMDARWDWLQHDWLMVPAESRKGGRRDRCYSLQPATLKQL